MAKLKIRKVCDRLFQCTAMATNVFLVATDDGLMMIDTGYPGWGPGIVDAMASIGCGMEALKYILVTHSHPDHCGSLAFLQAQANCETIMHDLDAPMVREGITKRPLTPSPGWIHAMIFKTFIATSPANVEPGRVDRVVDDGVVLDLIGERFEIIHVPGHAAGQIAILWHRQEGNVAFVADAAVNIVGLSHALASEDHDQMLQSLTKLSGHSFEIACFGHGKTIRRNASNRFQRRWG